MSRAHEKPYFFKYFKADTLKLVLQSHRLKWSAPTLFNDPFDHQATLKFGFSEGQFVAELARVLEQIVYGDPPPELVRRTQLGVRYASLRGTPIARDRDRFLNLVAEAAATVGLRLANYRSQFNELLVQQLAHSRVFCITEAHDNVVMWSHYADEHRGAVLKLNCVDEIDDNLLAAKSVTYTNEFPSFVTVEEWVGHLAGTFFLDYSTLFWESAYLKHSDWSYEREWRVHIPLMPYEDPGDGTSLYEKDVRCFGAMYFGCRMTNENKQELLGLRDREFPDMPVFEMVKAKEAFELESVQVR
jgi:hypothetical protein